MRGRLGMLVMLAATAAAAAPAAAASAPRLPPNQGVKGSACKALYVPGEVDPALDTSSLGDLPGDYEVGGPDGGGPIRRVMILVHGGGWYRVGRGMLATERDSAAAWRRAGWQTVNTDYRACRNSLDSVTALFDAVRAQVGPDVPICFKGESAGGQLALMVAAQRPDVACVITAAAPTDIYTIKAQGAAVGRADGARTVFGYARAAFGRARLAAVSPVSGVATLRARVLLADATDDALVPAEQQHQLASQLRAANPDAVVDVHLLEPGAIAFVHGTASAAAVRELEQRVAALVAPFGAAPITPTKKPSLLERLWPKLQHFRFAF